MKPSPEADAKPFIKWAGGKRHLLPEIFRRVPAEALREGKMGYAEPFAGGGAVFFALRQAFPTLSRTVLNDLNPKLIEAYQAVRDDTEALIASLDTLAAKYSPLPREERQSLYFRLRDRFNQTPPPPPTERAALLLFLNRTCFNGLYRENSKGDFNVPFGDARNPTLCDPVTLRADAAALRGITLLCGDFAETLRHVRSPTFFYLDPPYKPISHTASFSAYTKTPFGDAEQSRLCDFCRTLDRLGHRFLLSNSDPGGGFFDTLYAGFRIERVSARRSVSANPAKRGLLTELLISNLGD